MATLTSDLPDHRNGFEISGYFEVLSLVNELANLKVAQCLAVFLDSDAKIFVL